MALVARVGSSPSSHYGSCGTLIETLELPRLMSPTPPSMSLHGHRMSYTHRYQEAASASSRSQNVLVERDCGHGKLEQTYTLHGEESGDQFDAQGCEEEEETDRCSNRPACHKKLMNSFEIDHTFHPRLNKTSIKMLSRNSHASLPVVKRLAQVRNNQLQQQQHCHNPDFTFAPKLNSTSLKLAQQRSNKMPEVRARAAEVSAARLAEFYAEYTFKPHISKKSQQIVEGFGKGFMTRQQSHLEKRQKLFADSCKVGCRALLTFTKVPLTERGSPLSGANNVLEQPVGTIHHLRLCKVNNFKSVPMQKQSRIDSTASSSVGLSSCTSKPADEKYSSTAATRTTRKRVRSNTAPLNCHVSNHHLPTRRHQVSRQRSLSDKSSSGDLSQNSPNSKEGPFKDHQQQMNVPADKLLGEEFKSLSESDKIKRVRVVAERVMRAKKVFVCKGGYRTVKKGLRRRGWVEVDQPNTVLTMVNKERKEKEVATATTAYDSDGSDADNCNDESASDSDQSSDEDLSEGYMMLVRAVRRCEPFFIWTLKKNDVCHRNLHRDQLVNHFSRAWFTTKFGLCMALHDLPWYNASNAATFFPRCYLLSNEEEKQSFVSDYQQTAALSILKVLVGDSNSYFAEICGLSSQYVTTPSLFPINSPCTPSNSRPVSALVSQAHPVIPERAITLAIKSCEAFLGSVMHEDIGGSTSQLHQGLSDVEWSELLGYYHTLTFERGRLDFSSSTATRAEKVLAQMSEYWPQMRIDGVRNIWILKPGALSRGRGIVCLNKLEQILSMAQPSCPMKDSKWVIQKYIERPLLIFSTKFDIRQWFLVTDWNPLTLWMYKDCYLRFSSQLFTLDKLDVSIHLCNNSVQRHLQNCEGRASELPADNMWDSHTFKEYLGEMGEERKWNQVIFPGMKEAIVGVLLVSQDIVEERKNTFELFGADFMITEDFKPWLLEVNCSPTMEKCTAVTKRLCKQVLEDMLKVVVDRRHDKYADTGLFELVFRQPRVEVPQYVGMQLYVSGTAIRVPRGMGGRQKSASIPAVDLSSTFDFDKYTKNYHEKLL